MNGRNQLRKFRLKQLIDMLDRVLCKGFKHLKFMGPQQRFNELISNLQLEPHTEGGYFKRMYYCSEQIQPEALPNRYSSKRHLYSSIYYLLGPDDFSAFHRLNSDEIWHFFEGESLAVHFLNPDGTYALHHLGKNLAKGEHYQLLIPHGTWFAAEPSISTAYALIGCTVVPAFEYHDFELASAKELETLYPQFPNLIKRLCR